MSKGKYILIIVALAFLICGPSCASTWSKRKGAIVSQVQKLGSCKKRLALFMAADEIQKNSSHLLMDTPEHTLWSLKVLAIESQELYEFGKEAGYKRWAALMKMRRNIFAGLVRGDIGAQHAHDQIRLWARNYKALASSLKDECKSKISGSTAPVDVSKVRDHLTTWVSGTARIAASAESQKNSRKNGAR